MRDIKQSGYVIADKLAAVLARDGTAERNSAEELEDRETCQGVVVGALPRPVGPAKSTPPIAERDGHVKHRDHHVGWGKAVDDEDPSRNCGGRDREQRGGRIPPRTRFTLHLGYGSILTIFPT